MNKQRVVDFLEHFFASLPEGLTQLPQDLRANLRDCLEARLAALDLVTREEFDAQTRVLQRTREKLDALEKKLA